MDSKPVPRVSLLSSQQLLREYLVLVVEQSGFEQVGQYADADPFLANLVSDRPDVVVVDLADQATESENGPGLRVLRALRHQPGVRTLVLSRNGNPSSEICYREGASGYLDVCDATARAVSTAVMALSTGEKFLPFELLRTLPEPQPRDRLSPLVSSLSWRERQVLSYVAAGADNLKIAALLHISERTVKAHVSRLYQKLGSENRTQLALLAPQIGIRPSSEV